MEQYMIRDCRRAMALAAKDADYPVAVIAHCLSVTPQNIYKMIKRAERAEAALKEAENAY